VTTACIDLWHCRQKVNIRERKREKYMFTHVATVILFPRWSKQSSKSVSQSWSSIYPQSFYHAQKVFSRSAKICSWNGNTGQIVRALMNFNVSAVLFKKKWINKILYTAGKQKTVRKSYSDIHHRIATILAKRCLVHLMRPKWVFYPIHPSL